MQQGKTRANRKRDALCYFKAAMSFESGNVSSSELIAQGSWLLLYFLNAK